MPGCVGRRPSGFGSGGADSEQQLWICTALLVLIFPPLLQTSCETAWAWGVNSDPNYYCHRRMHRSWRCATPCPTLCCHQHQGWALLGPRLLVLHFALTGKHEARPPAAKEPEEGREKGRTFLLEFTGKLPLGSCGLKVEAGVSLCRGFAVWGINSRINI